MKNELLNQISFKHLKNIFLYVNNFILHLIITNLYFLKKINEQTTNSLFCYASLS